MRGFAAFVVTDATRVRECLKPSRPRRKRLNDTPRDQKLRFLSWIAVSVFAILAGLGVYIELTQPAGTPLIGIVVGVTAILAAVSAIRAGWKRGGGK
jgi:hypothetical protein